MVKDPGIDQTVELSAPDVSRERRRRARARVPALTVLYHPDLSRVGERLSLPELAHRAVLRLSRNEPRFRPPRGGSAVSLADPYLSRRPLILAGLDGGAVRLVADGTRTPVAVDGAEVDGEVELPVDRLERGVVLELASRVVLLLHLHNPAADDRTPDDDGIVGDGDAVATVRRELRRVADLEVPVLLRGETGTGKELVANAIHHHSRRRGAPFLSINLAAVPATLAASELFGATKGAFTGSVRAQAGYFERADGGTLFLDEIGEAPPEVQSALLRVLESGEVQRVGTSAPHRVDVRLLAATDRDLEASAAAGEFRAPLLHRLAGYEIHLPPLRERRDDFGRLLVHFLRRELAEVGQEGRLELDDPSDHPWLPASIVARLARHDWPGNVRQLKNVARHLAVAGGGAEMARVTPQVERLLREAEGAAPAEAQTQAEPEPAAATAVAGPAPPVDGRSDDEPAYRSPAEVGEEELVAALRAHRWQIKPAAQALGVSRPSLYNLIERCPRVRKVADLCRDEIEAAWEECGGDLEGMVDRLEVSESGLRQRLAKLELTQPAGGG